MSKLSDEALSITNSTQSANDLLENADESKLNEIIKVSTNIGGVSTDIENGYISLSGWTVDASYVSTAGYLKYGNLIKIKLI